MRSSFSDSDCVFLLKDLTGIIKFTPFTEKEKNIAKGISYAEMITQEMPISEEVNQIFQKVLKNKADELAIYIGRVADQIYARGKDNAIIVSLARAGSPIGALIKRYIRFKYNILIPHYSISIIRDRGIDTNALHYIRKIHPKGVLTFVDGWTGKGSISSELNKAIADYNERFDANLSSDLAVLADPARLSAIAGTRRDVCIPNACLNSTISGLVSRTILNQSLIGAQDFHGAIFYKYLAEQDVTNSFLETVENHFVIDCGSCEAIGDSCVQKLMNRLRDDFRVSDMSKVKLSIGESSRALIRRVPSILLVKSLNNLDLSFVLYLARQKGVDIRIYDTLDYECVTILK